MNTADRISKISTEHLITIKNSAYRKRVALYLKIWKNPIRGNFSATKTSKIVKTDCKTVLRALGQSVFFLRHPRRKTNFWNKPILDPSLKQKGSPYRNKIARYLKTWRKYYTLSDTAKELGVSTSSIGKVLIASMAYKKRRKLCNLDSSYALRWARKIKSIKILGGKCNDCGQNNIFVLDFHHKENNKEHDICRMMSAGNSWSEIKKEIMKCYLLCRNCHQKHHIDKTRFNRLKFSIALKERALV